MTQETLEIYGERFEIKVHRRSLRPADVPRLVVVGYQPNGVAKELLQLCVASIRHHTLEPHELWVVDNASPKRFSSWLKDDPELNVIFNHTMPGGKRGALNRLAKESRGPYSGSYRNAVALELAARIIDPDSRYLMTLHMDTMATQPGWLSYLRSHMSERVRGVGVRMDTARVRALHVLGMLFDFGLFRSLDLTFEPNMPYYDVGDGISMALERAGYELWACPNTLWQPELVERLPRGSPFRRINVDRAVDDAGRVIFMHLGRGVVKSCGDVREGKCTPEEWLQFGREVVLAS